jgi:hypothetical protein
MQASQEGNCIYKAFAVTRAPLLIWTMAFVMTFLVNAGWRGHGSGMKTEV